MSSSSPLPITLIVTAACIAVAIALFAFLPTDSFFKSQNPSAEPAIAAAKSTDTKLAHANAANATGSTAADNAPADTANDDADAANNTATGMKNHPAANAAETAAVDVKIVGTPGDWTLLRNGEPFYIKGACASTDYEGLVKAGANTIRTYSPSNTDRLEGARKAGLALVFGMWLGHERHGFSYNDPDAIERQRNRVLDAVRANKDDPQILMWAIGNEMEGDGSNPLIWQEINFLAQRIKEIDSRPVLTVIAGASPTKLKGIAEHCPDIDLLGINTYGGLPGVQDRMLEHLPNLPYMITEYGTRGPWESRKAPWGAEYEPTSSEKAALILNGYNQHIAAHAGRCLGSFVFLWGWKQEATHTWFNLYLEDGSPTEITDAMQRAWSGTWPQQRGPSIRPLNAPALHTPLSATERVTISAEAHSPYNSELRYQWELYKESRDRKSGGDAEKTPKSLTGYLSNPDSATTELIAPPAGSYRLFVTVKDDRGHAATANLPLQVQ